MTKCIEVTRLLADMALCRFDDGWTKLLDLRALGANEVTGSYNHQDGTLTLTIPITPQLCDQSCK